MIKKPTFKLAGRLYFLLTVLFLVITNCDSDPFFVPVKYIDGVPTTGTAKTPLTLTGTVNPNFANYNVIVWLIANAGSTGAVINGNILTTDTEGTVLIRAKVANGLAEGKDFTQDFKIVFKKTDVNEGEITYTVTANSSTDTTAINFNFNDDVSGLTAGDITITDGTGSVTKGTLTGSAKIWSLGVTVTTAGNITVKITKSGIESGTKTVTVAKSSGSVVNVTGVALNKTNLSLNVGATETLTATITPNDATNKNVTWDSNKTNIATVDANGVVTAVAVGTATITVTTADGNKTATCTVTVRLIEMVQISGGTFTMGSPNTETGSENDERPQHSVTLSNFYMGKYEVTQEQYQTVMGTNPSNFKTAVTEESGTPGKLPVEKVSWYDALVFCNKLSVLEGLNPAYSISNSTDPAVWGTVPITNNATWDAVIIVNGSNGYRLPTEAQWEYACRAGTTTAYNTGATINNNAVWYTTNSSSKTHQVGVKQANAFGLYDMHGNVYEWCWDWFGNYTNSAQTDPLGPSSGNFRVLRSGSYQVAAKYIRSAYRSNLEPENTDVDLGFRIVIPE